MGNCISELCPFPCIPICFEPDQPTVEPEENFKRNISKVHEEKKPLQASGVIVGIEPDTGKVCFGTETVEIPSRTTRERKLKEKIRVAELVYA